MSKQTFTRREVAQRAMTGAGAIFFSALAPFARAQVVDPLSDVPPPLPLVPGAPASGESDLLIALVPIQAGYALTEAQAREVDARLRNYPAAFAGARAYVLPEDAGPAFAASAPPRKGRLR